MCLTILSTFTEFNGNSFGDIVGFGMICLSLNTSYFVMDRFTDKVYILNDNGSFDQVYMHQNSIYFLTNIF